MVDISVLIATVNRAEHLRRCLSHLFESQNYIKEVIIIDQSNDDTTHQLINGLNGYQVPLIYKRIVKKGKANALNHGIAIARGEYLAFTDDDCMPAEDWLDKFCHCLNKHPGVHAVCGAVLPETDTDADDYLNLVPVEQSKFLEPQNNPIHPGLPGGNIIIRRDVMLKIGMFNENFGPGALFRSNIDGELAYRLYKHHYPVLFTPDVQITHSGWRNKTDNLRLKFDYAFGLGAFAGYYLRRRDSLPTRKLLPIALQKCRRFLLGVCLLQQERITDGLTHVRGFLLGGLAGWRCSDGNGSS